MPFRKGRLMEGRRRLRRVAGFTLLEAMVVLSITGVLLAAVFSVGNFGRSTAFRLGNRAMTIADDQIALESYRSTVTSLVVPPLTDQGNLAGEAAAIEASAFVGEPHQLSARWIAGRSGPCGPMGAAGRLTLLLARQGQRTVVACSLDEGEPVKLADLGFATAAFSYSEDGQTWVESWTVMAGDPLFESANPGAEFRKVYVRLTSEDAKTELIALAVSPRSAFSQ